MLEVVIPLMIYLTKYVFQIKQDLNLSMFNMITGINESKNLTKHVSCKCKCKLDGRKCKSDQWRNNDKCWRDCKRHHACGKNVRNPATCYCENGKYLARIMDDSAIMRNEITDTEAKSNKEETKTNFNENNANCKMQNFYILLEFLLISIGLLIAVSIYCYLIKYRAKQLLPFYYTNNELREVLY